MKHISLFLLLFCFFVSSVSAQEEVLVFGPFTPEERLKSESNSSSNDSLLFLPFFDDFSYPHSSPNSKLWQASDVFVNKSFGKNSLTIGVATFDALQANGKLHKNAGSQSFLADVLSSHPINLKNYRPSYRSDRLYIYNGSYQKLENSYYLFSSGSYKLIDEGLRFMAGDTIYFFDGLTYTPLVDSIFYGESSTYTYIEGSFETHAHVVPYSIEDSLALSFYYQAGGFGDKPNAGDSLVLEFYVPSQRQGVFINEIANNWIELYNGYDTLVTFSSLYIIPAPLDSIIANDTISKYKLSDVVIAPYSHIIISSSDFSLHTMSHAFLYLLNSDSTVLDSVTSNSLLSENMALARMPDGNSIWGISTTPSPGMCNPPWISMWSTDDDTGDSFSYVYIPLDTVQFLQKAVRFRFKNYASLSNDASHARNQDFWNIDMVWLDKHRKRSEPNVPDVAFNKPISQLYRFFSSIPLAHFTHVSEPDFRMTLEPSIENFDSRSRQVSFEFSVKKKHTGESLTFPFDSWLIPAFTQVQKDTTIHPADRVKIYDFIAQDIGNHKKGIYEFQYYFSTDKNILFEQLRWNDTNRVSFILDNYYAYDKGIPEAGYGLRSAPMGRVAYKFSPLRADTLRAINIYFNPTTHTQSAIFNLCVWKADAAGMPGELVYYMPGERVIHPSGLYNFARYLIDDDGIETGETGGIFIEGDFFIGWQQPYDILLNVGVDLQNTIRRKLYYNLGFSWEESFVNGALMMRPVFGNISPTVSVSPLQDQSSLYIYPTITQSGVSIFGTQQTLLYKIFNSSGMLLEQGYTEHGIELERYAPGVLFIQLFSNNTLVHSQSVIKQ